MARIKVLRFSGDGSTLIPTAAFTSSEMFTVAKHYRLDDAFLNASQGVGSVWGLIDFGGIDGRSHDPIARIHGIPKRGGKMALHGLDTWRASEPDGGHA